MWKVIELNHAVHVVPINDIIGHLLNYKCICGPRIDEDNTNMKTVWIHDSIDRREKNDIAA